MRFLDFWPLFPRSKHPRGRSGRPRDRYCVLSPAFPPIILHQPAGRPQRDTNAISPLLLAGQGSGPTGECTNAGRARSRERAGRVRRLSTAPFSGVSKPGALLPAVEGEAKAARAVERRGVSRS